MTWRNGPISFNETRMLQIPQLEIGCLRIEHVCPFHLSVCFERAGHFQDLCRTL
jgi:hypothetical protein